MLNITIDFERVLFKKEFKDHPVYIYTIGYLFLLMKKMMSIVSLTNQNTNFKNFQIHTDSKPGNAMGILFH